MVSDFRKKKFLHVFNTLFDFNRSGSVDENDYELAKKKLTDIRGYKPGEVLYEIVVDVVEKVWIGLQTGADSNKDGKISKDEWIEMWDQFAKNPSAAADWQNLLCRFIFQLEDATSDGAIDVEEFSSLYSAFGLDKDDSVKAFHKISKGKDTVSFEEFQQLWTEFFASEDHDAPGNFIFGCFLCSQSHSHSH